MLNAAGVYQVDNLLKAKLDGSGLEDHVRIVAVNTEGRRPARRANRTLNRTDTTVLYRASLAMFMSLTPMDEPRGARGRTDDGDAPPPSLLDRVRTACAQPLRPFRLGSDVLRGLITVVGTSHSRRSTPMGSLTTSSRRRSARRSATSTRPSRILTLHGSTCSFCRPHRFGGASRWSCSLPGHTRRAQCRW